MATTKIGFNEPIDFGKLLQDMLTAAGQELNKHWKEAKPYAEQETKAFIANIQLMAELKIKSSITEVQARLYLEIQKSSWRTVLLTIAGLSLLAVEAAINAALDVAGKVINKALGWDLL
jgi:hypothetical protein